MDPSKNSTYLPGKVAGSGIDAFTGERSVAITNVDVSAISQLVVAGVKRKRLHDVSAGTKELAMELKNRFRMLDAHFRRPRTSFHVPRLNWKLRGRAIYQ